MKMKDHRNLLRVIHISVNYQFSTLLSQIISWLVITVYKGSMKTEIAEHIALMTRDS